MDFTPGNKDYVAAVAAEAIERLEAIANAASLELGGQVGFSGDTLVYPNATNASISIALLERSQQAVRECNEHLMREPAIARVEVLDAQQNQRVIYICRTMPPRGMQHLASYRSPLGRLASLPIGESITLPNADSCEVVGKSTLHPAKEQKAWDSKRTVIKTKDIGPITVSSLREFLTSLSEVQTAEDVLDQIQAQERLSESLKSGLRRSVITKMGLRDQPILNSIQDEIFRLPIDTRLVLLGPPGTGKTTTLIRRLGQKLDEAYLTEDERSIIEAANPASRLAHDESWLMFTPTKLLRLYLKEAFAREQVPASDARIKTWDDFRWQVSKNVFGILRSATGSGFFVLRDEVAYLAEETESNAIGWFEDYFEWQREEFRRELGEAASALATSHMDGARTLAARLTTALNTSGWNALTGEAKEAQSLVGGIRGSAETRIDDELRGQLQRNPRFIDDLGQFLDSLGQEAQTDAYEDEAGEGEDEDEREVAHTPKAKAINLYKAALRARAKALASKRSPDKSSQIAKLIAWIDERSLPALDLTQIGQQLLTQANARPFTNPVQRYVNGFHRRYRKFRKLRQAKGRWYTTQPKEGRDIHALELDLILLAILRTGAELLSRQQVLQRLDQPPWNSLKPIQDLYRSQVLVDEATDFSPIQLACMSALGNARVRSFFACGDFNQRLTTWGTRSIDQLNWVTPGLQFREVNIAYRQTRQLNALARDIIAAVGGTNPIVELPKDVDNEGVAPALLEGAGSLESLTPWLAERLKEIEGFVGEMPSTAIFVNTEDDVLPLASLLDKALTEANLRVVPCSNGQVVGQDSDIRVFDIQHIKGLEFETVFFIGVDELAERRPTLFDKYIYVGATRAATYLGLTCTKQLPAVIESLRPQFTPNWSALGQTPGGSR